MYHQLAFSVGRQTRKNSSMSLHMNSSRLQKTCKLLLICNSEDPDGITLLLTRSALFAKTKPIFRERNLTLCFRDYNMQHLNIYNGPSRLNCIKLNGKLYCFFLFDLILYVLVNIFSVMSGRLLLC